MIASNPQPIPHCAMRTHVKQCLLQLCRRSLVSGGLRYLISAPFLYFGSRFHGLRQSPGPLQTCKEQQVYSPHHLRTRPTQTEFDKTEFELGSLVILMLYTCCFSAESGPGHPTTHTRPHCCSASECSSQSIHRSGGQIRSTCCFTARRNCKIDF